MKPTKERTNPTIPADTDLAALRDELFAWYRQNGRDLPWRRTRDPYRILVAEVMLQQTQVDRIVPRYHAFLDRFPTFAALATAPTADVIREWSGLGYNRRAVNLQRTAQAVIERHDGIMPHNLRQLLDLPGIGPYTAGAIACFAYEQDTGFFDTNIRRVLHRIFFGPELPKERVSTRELQALAEAIVPTGKGYEWNQSLMELGAVQCTARRPACLTCPVQSHCRAFPTIQTVIATLPKGTRKKKEEPFSGSTRYYRGRTIEALRDLDDGETLDLTALGPLVRDDFSGEHLVWLRELVQGLSRDGLAQIAEERAEYDADEPTTIRVRLP
ncbi:MAG TPA: A/G-specific adenine glycosylase [Nitrolancea sp.]|nr:A/G-specific adenine glycosylase [Nitrolancea sp.]